MKKAALFIFAIICSINVISQNIETSFTGVGESIHIDNVTATNMSTNHSLTFPGNETLTLELSTGIDNPEISQQRLRAFPNPFQDMSTILIHQVRRENVQLNIIDLSGQLVYQSYKFLEIGDHSFKVSLNKPGIYFLNLIGETKQDIIKLVYNGSNNYKLSISPSDDMNSNSTSINKPGMRGTQARYNLAYSLGDIMSFTCRSGKHTTIISDSPKNSKNYKVEFVDCTDGDNRTYKIVRIGNQMWMAENLAFMDHLSPKLDEQGIWVYGCGGTDIEEAISIYLQSSYGCLYDWKTATADTHLNGQDICPIGWHLPSDDEWKDLQVQLGGSFTEAQTLDWGNAGEVGNKLKSKLGWAENGNGKNSYSFNALPGGYRYSNGDYSCRGYLSAYWSSSENAQSQAYYRTLSNAFDGVYREACCKDIAFSVRCISND